MIEQKLYQDQNFSLSYLVSGDPKNKTVILIPPGLGRARYYLPLIKILSNKYFVITIDLPGVNQSRLPKNSIPNIANSIIIFLKNLRLENPTIIGESYGGSVAILISQALKVEKLVLIVCGEYFTLWQKIILSLFFIPTQFSSTLRKIYKKALHSVASSKPNVLDFSGFNDQQLKIFSQRFVKTIWFKLPPNYHSSVKILIVASDTDQIISRNNYSKIKNIFPNHKILYLHCNHFNCLISLEKNNYSDLLSFVSQ